MAEQFINLRSSSSRAETRTIRPCPRLEGEVLLPGDKSVSHRSVILNSLAKGKAEICNFAPGGDCLATIRCLRALGVKIDRKELHDSPTLSVRGTGEDGLREASNVLNAQNSGTTIRLLGGLLAGQSFLSIITGDGSLRRRPMGRLIQPLRLMGAEIRGRGGDSFAPLVITGKKLRGIDFTLPIPSAQIKSAILLAGLFAHGNTILHQTIPSRDHTERMLERMGASLEMQGNSISLMPLSSPLVSIDLCVPGDISSAAYFLVAGAIHRNARVVVKNSGINPTRTGIIDVLLAMGAKLRTTNERLEGSEPLADLVVESSELKGIEVGGDIIPRLIDEIPVLAVAGCVARGKTVIRGAEELKVKESDRIDTIASELSRLGARIEPLPDGMVIYGGRSLLGREVDSHFDHRLAMSLAVAGLVAKGETTIKHAQAAQVSYPAFWQTMNQILNY
ncbi:MAG: 3-phosphoshikimate 1-carboxyvinyltransferase [Chloroflexota bacterium]|nr:MAG: 3-phosphoshikimate 1-carboxyvinyltransferase [Chloroflexota bacterium]